MTLDGITPILATSYDERDRIAFDDIARQVEHLAGLPVTAVGIGFGSDIVRLTEAERDELVRAACDAAAGRVRGALERGRRTRCVRRWTGQMPRCGQVPRS